MVVRRRTPWSQTLHSSKPGHHLLSESQTGAVWLNTPMPPFGLTRTAKRPVPVAFLPT